MSLSITISHGQSDGLTEEVWSALLMDDFKLRLVRYARYERPTRRHRMRLCHLWSWYSHETRGLAYGQRLTAEQVPMGGVQAALINQLNANLQFIGPMDR